MESNGIRRYGSQGIFGMCEKEAKELNVAPSIY